MDLAAADAPVIDSLRRATSVQHTELESLTGLERSPELGRYAAALIGFEIFLRTWEPRVRSSMPLQLHGWLASRSRYELACRDLVALGSPPRPPERIESACTSLVGSIELDGSAAGFGSLYVLEGSALGGQVIAKAASNAFGFDRNNGAEYFNGFGDQTASRWRAFRQLLEDEVGTGEISRQAATKAAVQTFDALIGIFTLLRDASGLSR